MLKEIAFTSYSVTNVTESAKFYAAVLGQQPAKLSEQWAEFESGTGAFCLIAFGAPSRDGACIAFEVDDLDATLAHCKTLGVALERMDPTSDLMDTPVCRMFAARDPDGNQFMMHQRKEAHT